MVDNIALGTNEVYIVKGAGTATIVFLVAGAVNIFNYENTIQLASLNAVGETYTAVDTDFRIVSTSSSTRVAIFRSLLV